MDTEDNDYLILPGSNAFSDFRLARLANALGAEEVRALWVHYINPAKQLSRDDIENLQLILDYGEKPDLSDRLTATLNGALSNARVADEPKTAIFHVCPRAGTISPWSSQASNIAQICGLDQAVKRIERGMAIAATFGEAIGEDKVPQADSLHDRMTQTISRTTPDLNTIFGEGEPAPATTVDLQKGGSSPRAELEHANRELGLASFSCSRK
jgi:phosphoribosylformylglycinamidine synthase